MPAEIKDIMDHAAKLGQMVADHPAVAKFKQAQKAVGEDPEARSLVGDFNRMLESLSRQEQQGMTVSDAQRLSLEALQSKIVSNLKIKAMNIAQVDFMDLLRKVSESWQKPLGLSMGGPEAGAAPPPPSGPRIVGA